MAESAGSSADPIHRWLLAKIQKENDSSDRSFIEAVTLERRGKGSGQAMHEPTTRPRLDAHYVGKENFLESTT